MTTWGYTPPGGGRHLVRSPKRQSSAFLLEAAPAKEIDQLLANLARGKVPPHEALELLAVLDEPAMRTLVRSGNAP